MKRLGFAILGLFAVSWTLVPSGEGVALAAETAPEPMPTACAGEQPFKKDAKACLMPADFIKKLCAGSYPDVTLSLFAKGTPWTRAWLAGDVEAWSASGGFTSRANLAFDEEVIVLTRHAAPSVGGIVMTGAGANFDVLRWDGSCVSVSEGELAAKRPPAPKSSPMRFHRLEEATQKALLSSTKVKSSHDAVAKACSGEKAVCDRAERDLANVIASTVRSGATSLPAPSRRP